MRSSYEKAFPLIIGLEGHLSTDPKDPGNYYPDGRPGFTVWGLCTLHNKGLSMDMTLDQAKDRYLYDYWIPGKCDEYSFPFDIALFDSQVNPQNDPKLPGTGNLELLALKPENWQEYNLLRIARYIRRSDKRFVKGHINRVIKLTEEIRGLRL